MAKDWLLLSRSHRKRSYRAPRLPLTVIAHKKKHQNKHHCHFQHVAPPLRALVEQEAAATVSAHFALLLLLLLRESEHLHKIRLWWQFLIIMIWFYCKQIQQLFFCCISDTAAVLGVFAVVLSQQWMYRLYIRAYLPVYRDAEDAPDVGQHCFELLGFRLEAHFCQHQRFTNVLGGKKTKQEKAY